MYQLLLKQRFKFAVRMIKRNIGAYLILIAIVPCILILQSMIQTTHGMDIAVFIPYGILSFLFMNLFGTIPRMRISPETYIWKIEKTYIWRVKKIGKSMVLTLCVALILFWAFPMEGMVLRQFIVVMLCNPIVNMHTVLSTQYKYRDIMNICMLAVVMICFFYGSVFVTSILLIIYGLYFILYPYFSYQAIIPFFQQYNQMLYGFLNREYDTVLQTQDEVFFQNNQKEMKGLMKKYYGSRYRFLMVYEVVSIVRRKKQAEAQQGPVTVLPIGKRSQEYFAHHGADLFTEEVLLAADVSVGECFALSRKITEGYLKGDYDAVKLCYTRFDSMMTQTAVTMEVLPLTIEPTEEQKAAARRSQILYKPSSEEVFRAIIPEYVAGIVYGAVCESVASELAARRTAMDAATKNAGEMIDPLNLYYNRARQAAITQEITEIVAGAAI